ncbi:hypothetical protein [Mycobacterium lacus]|uniref:hypothetical protein n=1 Tax=Mycobacterium lacus TaxID=169765 RepID=UPI00111C8D7F|nr:hypothetical protein [Mycobacterium lacus]MCV7123730.1 hypothetical protein [Mycobacterium lacus]
MTSQSTNPAPPPAAPARRHSTVMVIGAGLAGLVLGALAVFALAGVTWKVRVELPPPLYPSQLTSTPPGPPAAPGRTPTSATSVLPAPPLPPPHS